MGKRLRAVSFSKKIWSRESEVYGLNCCVYLDPQVEQLEDEQLPQEVPAVLLKVPPTENANADMIRFTFLLLHFGQAIFSDELKTNFSKSS